LKVRSFSLLGPDFTYECLREVLPQRRC